VRYGDNGIELDRERAAVACQILDHVLAGNHAAQRLPKGSEAGISGLFLNPPYGDNDRAEMLKLGSGWTAGVVRQPGRYTRLIEVVRVGRLSTRCSVSTPSPVRSATGRSTTATRWVTLDRGHTLGTLVRASKCTLAMTGALFDGMATSLFYLPHRLDPRIRAEFAWSA
jgi:hypothetical protein